MSQETQVLSALKSLQNAVQSLQKNDNILQKNFASMQESIVFMQKNMVTKDYLDHRLENFATKQDLEAMNSNLITHIDGFVGMHKGLDLELVSLRSKYQRLESHVNQLAKHTSLTLE